MRGRATLSQVSGGAFKAAPIARRQEQPSAFLLRCLSKCIIPPNSVIVDLACGRGRHLSYLAAVTDRILAIDIDRLALRAIHSAMPGIGLVQANLEQGIPLASCSASLIVAIHAPMLTLMSEFARVLVPGGYFILETFNGRGENWKSLPKAGTIPSAARLNFELLRVKETPVGPAEADAVTVKLFAFRKP